MSTLNVEGIKNTAATSDTITFATDGTCTAKVTNNQSNRNLVINGAMQCAQYGVSSGSSGFKTVDRFAFYGTGLNAAVTVTQADVASGTTPYTLGFRKSHKIANGAQTGPDAGDYIYFSHKIEAQDMATSGWNYTSTSSYVTLSFWIKSSVAQNFYGYLKTADGTSQNYPFETGALSANTWTKITKTIPGHANLQFDMDNNMGVEIVITPFFGTDKTGSISLNAWGAWSSSNRLPDMTSTWFTTNGATFEYTGVQLTVTDYCPDFPHSSYADELIRCQRYCCQFPARTATDGTRQSSIGKLQAYSTTALFGHIANFPVEMRTAPTATTVGTIRVSDKNGSNWREGNSNLVVNHLNKTSCGTGGWTFGTAWFIAGGCATMDASKDSAANYLEFTAEL